MQIYHYFTNDEAKNMNKEFMATLDRARAISGVPYIITRGYSTPDHNFAVGGVSDSAHCNVDKMGNPDSLAIDLLVSDDHQASLILKGLKAVGFNRIGIYFRLNGVGLVWSHIHVDDDLSKPQDVTWAKLDGANGA